MQVPPAGVDGRGARRGPHDVSNVRCEYIMLYKQEGDGVRMHQGSRGDDTVTIVQ